MSGPSMSSKVESVVRNCIMTPKQAGTIFRFPSIAFMDSETSGTDKHLGTASFYCQDCQNELRLLAVHMFILFNTQIMVFGAAEQSNPKGELLHFLRSGSCIEFPRKYGSA